MRGGKENALCRDLDPGRSSLLGRVVLLLPTGHGLEPTCITRYPTRTWPDGRAALNQVAQDT